MEKLFSEERYDAYNATCTQSPHFSAGGCLAGTAKSGASLVREGSSARAECRQQESELWQRACTCAESQPNLRSQFSDHHVGTRVQGSHRQDARVILSRKRCLADSLLQQMFLVRFLGSMAVKTDHTTEVIYEAMRQVLAARAIHNIFRMTESHLMVTSQALRYIRFRSDFLTASSGSYFKAHLPA